jgi:hypothetical protein
MINDVSRLGTAVLTVGFPQNQTNRTSQQKYNQKQRPPELQPAPNLLVFFNKHFSGNHIHPQINQLHFNRLTLQR